MADKGFVIDTKEGIAFYHLCAIKGAAKLELKGLRHSSGRSVIAHAKRTYNLKGNRESIVAQLEAMVEKAIAETRQVEQLATQG